MLYLCDNQALLKAVKKWVGEGGEATLVGESDVSGSARRRHLVGSNPRAPKKNNSRSSDVAGQSEKAHRGELADKEADIQADKAISGKDVSTEWRGRTNRVVFTWQEPRRKGGTVSYEHRKSTWTRKSGVCKAIRRGSAEEEVRKHQDPGSCDRSLQTNHLICPFFANKDDESM